MNMIHVFYREKISIYLSLVVQRLGEFTHIQNIRVRFPERGVFAKWLVMP